MKTDQQTMKEIRRLLDAYTEVCNENLGTPISRKTYIDYADRFVRWIDDRFIPGETLRR